MQRAMISERYSIREAEETDWSGVAAFLGKINPLGADEAFLARKYTQNPAGRGRIFVIEDLKQEIKGILGYLPHMIYNRRKSPVLVMESVDLFLAPEARGKKIFPELQGRAMKSVEGPLIAFPNRRSEEITVKLGWERLAPIEDWILPVGPTWTRQAGPARFAQTLARGCLKAYGSLWRRGRDHRIKLKPISRFEHSFDQLVHPFRVGRAAAYLNWRYVENPLRRFEMFEFHLEEKPVGYCVISREKNAIVLYDFFSVDDEPACVRLLAKHFRRDDQEWLVFRGIGLKLWRLGFFRVRSRRSLIAYRLPRDSWVLTLGDSDW